MDMQCLSCCQMYMLIIVNMTQYHLRHIKNRCYQLHHHEKGKNEDREIHLSDI